MHPIADFSSKQRVFRFEDGAERTDLGRSTSYWMMQGDRRCVSETSVDIKGQIFETYYFAKAGLETLSPEELFSQVKIAHLSCEHDADIAISVSSVLDDTDEVFWALEVRIADREKLFRKRPPFFEFYNGPDIPMLLCWPAYRAYEEAQNSKNPFILIEGEAGSTTWRDSDIYVLITLESKKELDEKLSSAPLHKPTKDYAKFNAGIIDARDLTQPFNETVYKLAKDWRE